MKLTQHGKIRPAGMPALPVAWRKLLRFAGRQALLGFVRPFNLKKIIYGQRDVGSNRGKAELFPEGHHMSNPEWRGNRTLSLQAARCGWSRPARDTAAAHWQVKPGQTGSKSFRRGIYPALRDQRDVGSNGETAELLGVPPI